MVKFILMLMLAPLLCFANPAPFGLEIGKMTVQEFKEKYQYKYEGENKYSKGEMFEINPKTINFEGLKKINVVFDQNKILVFVIGYFNTDKFDYLLDILKDKYKVTDKTLPAKGEKLVVFDTEELHIDLKKSDLNSQVELGYSTKKMWYDLVNYVNQERAKNFSNL